MIWTPIGGSQMPLQRHLPSKASIDQASSVLSQTIRNSGLSPGVYRSREDVDYNKLIRIHRSLCEVIEGEVARFSALDFCRILYFWHEGIMRDEIRWGPTATVTQALRSLTELGLKSCEVSGVQAYEKDCDYMLALAQLIVGWDFIWDQFTTELFSQEIVIGEDYSFNPQPLPRPYKAMQAYQQYISEKNRIDEIHRAESLTLPYEDFEPRSILLRLENEGLSELNACLQTEMGYSLLDYIRFVYALCNRAMIDEFDLVGFDLTEIIVECQDILGIPEPNARALIEDFTLSAQTLGEVTTTEIFSVRRRRRDSRLMRRPIVLIDSPPHSVLMFGLRMLTEATELLWRHILTGRIPVARWSANENVESAFGRIRSAIGTPLRDAIARDCEQIVGKGRVIVEKDYISGVKSDRDLGAADVFVVDDAHNRFILVEAKNSAPGGGTPQELRDERCEFLDEFLPKLKGKAAWFRAHVTELKREFRIPAGKYYTVEEVIVVHRQRFWVMADVDRLPIIDKEDFQSKLATGQKLLSDPVDPPI